MRLRTMLASFAAAALLVPACAPRALRPGEQRVVETSGRKGAWVSAEAPSFEQEDVWYFRGQAMNVADLTLGLRQAEADAKKRVVGKIAEQVASEYSEYSLGANARPDDHSAFVSDGISWATDTVSVSGAAPAKVYWEKIVTGRGSGTATTYNVHVLLALSGADYDEARNRALATIEERAQAAANRRAEEAATRLRQRLDTGATP